MATKHFFPDTHNLVVRGLESLVAKNPHLSLDAANKVVYLPSHSTQKVSVLSGGGAGHEPAWCGYVGNGLLSAAISGEVFASPSTKQIMAAVEKVPSDKGVILCITNYTGDNLHFGLAREKVAGSGRKVGMLRMTDDVGLGREKTSKLGRRGLAGNMFVLKLCGAAAEEDYDFDTCFAIGESVNGHCVTIGSSLDYCHIPGRAHHESLPANTLSVAQGIHNEA
ncbi:Dak1-domain-containing protein, partial [Aureobasidium melanogenum]